MRFKNKVLMIGFGSVGKCTLPILLKHISIPYQNITVLDFADKREPLRPWIAKGAHYVRRKITPKNIARILPKYVAPGGLLIDLSWNIECLDILRWCHEHRVLYVNTSVEEWDPYANFDKKTPFEKSLYYKQMEIRKMIGPWEAPTTAVLDHGANPGLISHFAKKGIADISERMLRDKMVSKTRKNTLEKLLGEKNFPRLAMETGIKTIHVSERDTQITDQPKEVNEFVGTWSIEGLREEGMSPAEMGWGTHEKKLPHMSHIPPYGPKNQIFLSQMGMNTWVRTWVPHEEIAGMVIRHAEAFTISDHLTVWNGKKALYRPTVHYAYMPSDETLASLVEFRARNYKLQPKQRIMSDEIIKGEDKLGALLMGHRYHSWWTGSILGIEESRRLVPHQNATTIQVAIGVVSAILWMIKNPKKGICEPDDLPYEEILEIAKPYLGKLLSIPSDWSPRKNYRTFYKENPNSHFDKKNLWRFQNFLLRN